MLSTYLNRIGDAFPLKELDAGEYRSFEAAGMRFSICWYEATGLGNVSTIAAEGPGMSMETLVVDAFERDVPLFSMDSMAGGGNRMLLLELYNTLLDSPDDSKTAALEALAQKHASLPNLDLGSHWYDSLKLPVSVAKRADDSKQSELDAFTGDYLQAYLDWALELPALETPSKRAEKRSKTKAYVDGLLAHGGPSTDRFEAMLGADKTRDLFSRIVFGVEA